MTNPSSMEGRALCKRGVRVCKFFFQCRTLLL